MPYVYRNRKKMKPIEIKERNKVGMHTNKVHRGGQRKKIHLMVFRETIHAWHVLVPLARISF